MAELKGEAGQIRRGVRRRVNGGRRKTSVGMAQWIMDRQKGLSFMILILLAIVNYYGWSKMFFELQYPSPMASIKAQYPEYYSTHNHVKGASASPAAAAGFEQQQQGALNNNNKTSINTQSSDFFRVGPRDAGIVFTSMVGFTFLRKVLMDHVFIPFGQMSGKIQGPRQLERLAEQSWSMIYYMIAWLVGVNIYYKSSYFLDSEEFWRGWPHRDMPFELKSYYLVQLGFWLQQLFVLNMEKPRKDYLQMFSHHIITCSLMIGSYYYYFTRVGHAILCLMDFVDILLPAAKILRYLGYSTCCDIMFGLFMVFWFLTRHVLYLRIMMSTYYETKHIIGSNCCFQDPASPDYTANPCFTDMMWLTFNSLLLLLQILTLMWFAMIVRVAYRVISGDGAADTRSDSEDEDQEQEQDNDANHLLKTEYFSVTVNATTSDDDDDDDNEAENNFTSGTNTTITTTTNRKRKQARNGN